MTDKPQNATETGEQPNMTPGKGGIVPPFNRRFGQPNGNPRNDKGISEEALWLRHEAQKILHELLDMPATTGKKAKKVRRLVALLRRMSSTNQPAAWVALLKIAYPGAFVEKMDLTSDGEPIQVIEIVKTSDKPG